MVLRQGGAGFAGPASDQRPGPRPHAVFLHRPPPPTTAALADGEGLSPLPGSESPHPRRPL